MRVADITALKAVEFPGYADLAWAFFPCQDLSLAGSGAGLRGERSGTFWPFWSLIQALSNERHAPPIVVLENVCGALTWHGGKGFAVIGAAIASEGHRFGALVVDAVRLVPQSRTRLFIVAVSEKRPIPASLVSVAPDRQWHTPALVRAYEGLSERARRKAIFVHGCFWHQHDCRRGARLPKSNRGYWLPKLRRNRERDAQHRARLCDMGWKTLTVWECEIADRDALARRIAALLN